MELVYLVAGGGKICEKRSLWNGILYLIILCHHVNSAVMGGARSMRREVAKMLQNFSTRT